MKTKLHEVITWSEKTDTNPEKFIFIARGSGYKFIIYADPKDEECPVGKTMFAHLTNNMNEMIESINVLAETHVIVHVDKLKPLTKKELRNAESILGDIPEFIDKDNLIKDIQKEIDKAVENEDYKTAAFFQNKLTIIKK